MSEKPQAPLLGLCHCCQKTEIFGYSKNKRFCDECLKQKRLNRNRRKIKSLSSLGYEDARKTDLAWLKAVNDFLAKAKALGLNYAEYQAKERGK